MPKTTIAEHGKIDDPRVERTKQHELIDIITIAICVIICGADTWVDIENYGGAKIEWLKQFLELPNGIPSHDTFAQVFARINPEQLQQSFLNWVESISNLIQGEVVAIDGKSLGHSYDTSEDKGAISMVSAWATANRLVLGQVKVDHKSNEITAIPELLKVLSLNGCIVTIDAIGCQTKIIKDIVAQDADYVITLKPNQSSLDQRVEDVFKQALINGYQGYTYSNYRLSAQEHDRSETRYYEILSNIQELVDPEGRQKLNSVGRVDYLRVKANGKSSLERRYYISSLPNDAELLAKAIRGHWNIENQLHWVLDVQFSEDDSRIRKDNAPQNLAIIRQIALNLFNQDKTIKAGINTKRKRAGWDNNYLLKV